MISSQTGTRIRDRRMDQGLRQADLAQAVGISPSYLNLIEHNRRRIAGRLLGDIARALGVDPSQLRDGAARDVLDKMLAAADALKANAEVTRVDELAARYPGWAGLIVQQADAVTALQQRVQELNDRMSHDPALSTSLHEVISAVTSIRSTASILRSGETLDADWLSRFHGNIYSDAVRLADSSDALIRYLDAPAAAKDAPLTPVAEVEAALEARGFWLPKLEAGATVADAMADFAGLSPSALSLLERYLTQYREDCVDLPATAFAERAASLGYDAAAISRDARTPMSRVLRRMAHLPPDQGHPPFGLVVCDASAAITFLRPVAGFRLSRGGNLCPLWPLFTALGQVGRPVTREVTMPDSAIGRLRCLAVAEMTGPVSLDWPPVITSTMLVMPDAPATDEAPLPVGPTCRICPRSDCPARREPSSLHKDVLAL